MIRSGGENIHPEEVETVVAAHPAVAECCVIALPDSHWGQAAVACVVAAGEAPAAAELDAFCRASALAGFKRPKGYLFVDGLPRNAANKVLRRELRRIAGEAASRRYDRVPRLTIFSVRPIISDRWRKDRDDGGAKETEPGQGGGCRAGAGGGPAVARDFARRHRWRGGDTPRPASRPVSQQRRDFWTRSPPGSTPKVIRGTDEEAAAEPVRDRLFDVLARRFEALQPHRTALASIFCDALAVPRSGLAGGRRLLRSMTWSLETAGVSGAGPLGAIRVRGLAAVFMSSLMVFLRDDTDDLARTMAHLDRNLGRADRLMARLNARRA